MPPKWQNNFGLSGCLERWFQTSCNVEVGGLFHGKDHMLGSYCLITKISLEYTSMICDVKFYCGHLFVECLESLDSPIANLWIIYYILLVYMRVHNWLYNSGIKLEKKSFQVLVYVCLFLYGIKHAFYFPARVGYNTENGNHFCSGIYCSTFCKLRFMQCLL